MSEDAFLRAVAESPDDDGPKLVYADFLDENGRWKQAKYVRVGVALHHPINHAPWCLTPWDCDHDPDYNRGYMSETFWTWHKGFVGLLSCTMNDFMGGRCRELFRAHPIASVRITDRDPSGLRRPGRPASIPVWQRESVTRRVWGDDWESRRYSVPDDLFDYLPEDAASEVLDDAKQSIPHGYRFRSRQDAFQSLAVACVRYGRRLAGSPPLPKTIRQPVA